MSSEARVEAWWGRGGRGGGALQSLPPPPYQLKKHPGLAKIKIKEGPKLERKR